MSDEIWQKFIEDTERDIRTSAAPREPSARARMVTERLRRMDEEAVRRDAKGAKKSGRRGRSGRRGDSGEVDATDHVRQAEGRRTGPDWREMDGRATRRRRLRGFLGVPVAAALALVAVKPSLIPGDPFGTGTGTGKAEADATASPRPAETARPTAPPSAAASDTPTLDRPFAGSPALRWADGAAGIVLPKATAVGALSKEQVAQALWQTRTLLVDAYLAPATLRGERPATALGVIDPGRRNRSGNSTRLCSRRNRPARPRPARPRTRTTAARTSTGPAWTTAGRCPASDRGFLRSAPGVPGADRPPGRPDCWATGLLGDRAAVRRRPVTRPETRPRDARSRARTGERPPGAARRTQTRPRHSSRSVIASEVPGLPSASL